MKYKNSSYSVISENCAKEYNYAPNTYTYGHIAQIFSILYNANHIKRFTPIVIAMNSFSYVFSRTKLMYQNLLSKAITVAKQPLLFLQE